MSEDKRFDYLKAKSIRENLQADCTKCFGLRCTALNVTSSNDFAMNKGAGEPCLNLQPDFRCEIHSNLRKKDLKGVLFLIV